jgi:hypothetical protein
LAAAARIEADGYSGEDRLASRGGEVNGGLRRERRRGSPGFGGEERSTVDFGGSGDENLASAGRRANDGLRRER